jgi:4-carboxymuconolactone decarboxylase
MSGSDPSSELYSTGLDTRRDVLGHEYVAANLAGSDEFMMAFQDAVTQMAWGYAWSRPGLDRRSRFLVTLGILAGLGRHQELGIDAQGAVQNGLTVAEIKEVLIQATSYCGTPAGRQCFLAVHAALESIDALPEAAP